MGRNVTGTRRPSINDQQVPWDGVSEREFIASCQEVITWIAQENASPEIKIFAEEVTNAVVRFSTQFYCAKRYLKGFQLKEFHDACKDRSSDLKKLITALSTQESEITVAVVCGNTAIEATDLRYLSSKAEIFAISNYDEDSIDNVFTLTRLPKFYAPLFVAAIRGMQAYNNLRDIDAKEARTCLELVQILISVSRIYLEFRSNKMEWKKREDETLSLLTQSSSLDKSSEWYTVAIDVAHDIEEGTLPYVRDLKAALMRNAEFLSSPFSEKDYYLSAKASTSKHRKLGKNNALVSSAYEVDHLKDHSVDEVIGYKSHYNLSSENVLDDKFKTTHINQHKLKARAIHIANNAIQDRCNWIHRRTQALLSSLPSDCTKNQRNGVQFVILGTNPEYRSANGYPSIYCKDFSNATDTLNPEFQSIVLSVIFPKEIVDFWQEISSMPKVMRRLDRAPIEYIQAQGNPQGILGSFNIFAICHHFIMLMVMKQTGRENILSRNFYRVLGDDSAINTVTPDPERKVEESYISCSTFAGLQADDKTKDNCVYYEDRAALAEFAKVTVLNGEITSPPPIRIMSRVETGTSNYYSLSTAVWMLTSGYNLTKVLDHLLNKWYGYDESTLRVASCLVYGGVIPQFRTFHRIGEFSEVERARAAFAYAIVKFRGSIAEAFLNDKIRESLSVIDFQVADAIEALLPSNPDEILDLIEDPNHKLIKSIERNLLIEDSLKSILGMSDVRLLLPVIELTDDEINALITINDLIESLQYGDIDDISLLNVLSMTQNLGTLDRFQVRSTHKRAAREIQFLNQALQVYSDLFDTESSVSGD